MKQDITIFTQAQLLGWTKSVLQYYGYKEISAQYIAQQLVEANLRGIDSHGIMRLPIYIARVEAGLVDSKATPKFKRKGSILLVDGCNVQGQVATMLSVEKLIALSRRKKIAACFIKNSTHFGTAGFYARALADAGKIGLAFTNAESCVAPFGGKEPILGTNPIAFAVPTDDFTINVDLSTSITSFGEIFISRDAGKKIPSHWGFDKEGNITDNPHDIVALRTMAHHKGFALSVMVEILSGVISGASVGKDIGNMYKDFSKFQNVGHCLIAIDIPSIMPLGVFKKRMAMLIESIYDIRREDDTLPIMIPGEKTHKERQRRVKEGIPISSSLLDALQVLAKKTNIPLDL